MRRLIKLIALSFILLGASCASAYAQTTVRGTVKDADGEPVIGAGIMVQGTTTGAIADVDGTFTVNCPSDAVLEISSIGFITQLVSVNGRTELSIILEQDTNLLDEVVVVGYGVQKKSVVSASISSITEDALKHQSNNRIDAVLQGMSSGVTVSQSSGAPGASSQVRVRGIGSIHDSAPLYIVDGLAISGGIDYLNPNDIERIEVLKDAASAAVYGARGANGVILVTTKQGKKGTAKVSYDFSYGIQNPWRKPQVLNATEYAIIMNEASLNNGAAPLYDDPYSLGEGTDWVGAVFNRNAPIQKHDISVSGGTENVSYALSGGYLSQEGIIGGNYGRSNYDRFTLRESTQITVFDESENRNYLNSFKLSQSVSYANINSTGISENTEYGSILGSALGMSPLESIYADDATENLYKTLYPEGYPYIIRDAEGRAFTVVDGVKYNEQSNPLAMLNMPGAKYDTHKFMPMPQQSFRFGMVSSSRPQSELTSHSGEITHIQTLTSYLRRTTSTTQLPIPSLMMRTAIHQP